MEPITVQFYPVDSGEIPNDEGNDRYGQGTATLYQDPDWDLWMVIIEEMVPGEASPRISRGSDEIRHQAVLKACMKSGRHHIYQIYKALGIPLSPLGTIM